MTSNNKNIRENVIHKILQLKSSIYNCYRKSYSVVNAGLKIVAAISTEKLERPFNFAVCYVWTDKIIMIPTYKQENGREELDQTNAKCILVFLNRNNNLWRANDCEVYRERTEFYFSDRRRNDRYCRYHRSRALPVWLQRTPNNVFRLLLSQRYQWPYSDQP